ncbi:MAG TPA: protein kinase [Spirillospora sp.]
MPSEPAGERLLARRYRLVTQVGRGGMGTVWQAHDEVLGRDVAVKEVILPHGLTDEERAVHHKRTFREARAAARLGHPGVVTVYDVVEEDERPWIIMELIKARSLDQVIKQEGPLEPRRAAEIARQMLAALHAAHEAGVLHRDVKPSNVLITGKGRMGERAVLTDFGIATASGDATLTQTGLVMGSPAYIAPERARGRTAGPKSDLWSLGVTMYAMLHGKSPFERPEPMASLIAVISEEPDPPENGGRLIPVIEGLLRKNPDERMDAIEAGALLDEIVRQETVDTQRTMAVEYPGEAGDPGGATTPDPAAPAAATARPDQLTSLDIPAGKARSAKSASVLSKLRAAGKGGGRGPGPSETRPDADDAASWSSQGAAQGGGALPAAHAVPGHGDPGLAGPGQGTAVHFPPTTHTVGRPALASNRNVLIIAALIVIVILVVAGIALANGGGDEKQAGEKSATAPAGDHAASPAASPEGTATPSPVSAPATTPAASVTPSGQIPAGFRRYHDRSGYSVLIPEGWSGPERKVGGDFFYSPDREVFIQIDQTDDPGESAIDDWRELEQGGGGRKGYKLIGIRPTGNQPPVPDTGNGDKSADWEYTYDGENGRVHVLNRGFVTEDREHGYAILLRAPDRDWSRVFAELQPVYQFFEPASD